MKVAPYTRKVNFYETDQMGIVHHSNHIRFFEEARVDFMEKINFGYKRLTGCGIDLAVSDVSCSYKSMIRFGDTVDIHTAITELTQVRLTMEYTICDAATGEVKAVGTSRHFPYHGGRQQVVSLKREVPELYGLLRGLMAGGDAL